MNVNQVFFALADSTRRAVLEQVRDGPRSVQQIADKLPVSRPAVSQHLKVLKEANLVVENAQGTKRIYQLNPEGWQQLRIYLDEYWESAMLSFKNHIERKFPND